MYRKGGQRGFSLIELLVVISIISLLSSVVLTAVNGARTTARNTTRIKLVQEYIKALELSRADTNAFPLSNTWVCLGDYSDDLCWDNSPSFPESSSLNSSISTYISNPPGDSIQVTSSAIREGMIYTTNQTTTGGRPFEIRYFLEGDAQKCLGVELTPSSYSIATYCRYIHQ